MSPIAQRSPACAVIGSPGRASCRIPESSPAQGKTPGERQRGVRFGYTVLNLDFQTDAGFRAGKKPNTGVTGSFLPGAAMLAPDLQFMVHSSEVLDDEGYVHRGSKITQLERGEEPPEWRLRDFAFAAYSGPNAPGLREVHFGRRSVWVFASARDHTEEIVVFRKGSDARRKPDKGLFMGVRAVQQASTMAVPLEIANASGPDDENGTLVKKNPAESGHKDAPNEFRNF
ncbi:hypothetical protein AK812_SmicGene17756 [Symbiodinium microadriaticum]|uniref:Uncharacterized protein n=1 Tax=Symbiodinium microadriaticum TaxID=2951 RepID=A0A1Q9DWX7_SYMMI|nr:hypothetical protein AK812_SmicGene17756 [Symbiodinium microadriaticum]